MLLRQPFFLLAALLPLLVPAAASSAENRPWREVMPGAGRIGPVEGNPPAAAAYAGDDPVGYVFSTLSVSDAKGYSGKTLDILVGIDAQARITGAKLVEQHEPIGATGGTVADLEAFRVRLRRARHRRAAQGGARRQGPA